MEPYRLLSVSILDTAIRDYRELRRCGADVIRDPLYGNRSVSELEEFFRSDWASELCAGAGLRLDGKTLLWNLQHEALPQEEDHSRSLAVALTDGVEETASQNQK
jgi:hypothetical protein